MQKKIFCVLLSMIIMCEMLVPVGATRLSNAKSQQQKTQNSLNNMQNQISEMEEEQAQASEKLTELQTQLVDILTSITICEEEIETKLGEIDSARDELMVVQHQEEEQYAAMKKRVKFMYEQGDKAYMQLLLESSGYTEMVNKADYVEKLYEYDKKLLASYVENKEQVQLLKERLEDEEADLEAANFELSQEQKALETLVEEQKEKVEDFASQLEVAKKKAADYKLQLEQQNRQIQQLEKEEQLRIQQETERRRKEAEEALKKRQEKKNEEDGADTDSDDGDAPDEDDEPDPVSFSAGAGDTIEVPTSSLGMQIVSYACQFVGNPYVFGGTSLTNGTDCSGFTMSVYAHFGISIPRDSTSQRSCGVGVDYASAQPGDLICYAGHVALYIGNGMIVHASTERTGITYSPATYRTILAVRRIV